LTGFFNRAARLHHQFPTLLKEGVASLGELHGPPVPGKEIDSKFLFELPYLPAQGRLRNVQALRRLSEIQMLRHGDEISDVPQFHDHAFYIGCTGAAMSLQRFARN
jgi:hypothetical protein